MVSISKKLLTLAGAATAFASLGFGAVTGCALTPTTSILRSEGTAEQLGPLVITCSTDAGGAIASTGTLNLTLTGGGSIVVTSKVLDAATSKTELVATVTGAATQYFGTISGGNINFANLAVPTTPALGQFVITVSNIRINANALQVNLGTAPTINVTGYVATSNPGNGPLQAVASQQVAYIQNGYAAPVLYKAYTTGTLGMTNGVAATTGKNDFQVCTAASPLIDAKDLTANAQTAGASLAFAIRITENFTSAFKSAASEASAAAVTVGTTTNTVANGTRVQVTFTAPAGVSVFVPTVVINSAAGNGKIQLSGSAAGTAHAAVANSTDLAVATAGKGGPLALVSGTAVFEVTADDNLTLDQYDIPVFVVTKSNGASLGSITAAVSLSPTGSSLIPNFSTAGTTLTGSSVLSCSTTLIFPFVSSQLGFDTGLVISNTSSDPLGTTAGAVSKQSGACALSLYGDFGGGTAPTTAPSTGTIASGAIYTNLLSLIQDKFQGYIVAKCDFQYAKGFAYINYGFGTSAAVTTGYLADVLATATRAAAADSLGH